MISRQGDGLTRGQVLDALIDIGIRFSKSTLQRRLNALGYKDDGWSRGRRVLYPPRVIDEIVDMIDERRTKYNNEYVAPPDNELFEIDGYLLTRDQHLRRLLILLKKKRIDAIPAPLFEFLTHDRY